MLISLRNRPIFALSLHPFFCLGVGCPSQKLITLLKEVKSVGDEITQHRKAPAPVGGGFVLSCASSLEFANNKKVFGDRRGQHPSLQNQDVQVRSLYPWTIDGACIIAGTRVQLVAPDDSVSAKFRSVILDSYRHLLRCMCEQALGHAGQHVHSVLLRAIDDVTTQPRYYQHQRVKVSM